MKIGSVIWLAQFLEKIERKHGVSAHEVEEVFENRPRFRRIESGDVAGENLYRALGPTGGGGTWPSSLSTKGAAERL